MKKVFLTIAVVLMGLASCKKKDVTPTEKSDTVVETRFVTEDGVAEDTYYALQFGIYETANWSQQLFINECGEVGVNTNFYGDDSRRVEIYKNGDNNSGFVWMGEIQVNPSDSSFIITEVYGPNVDIIPVQCDGYTKLQIQE